MNLSQEPEIQPTEGVSLPPMTLIERIRDRARRVLSAREAWSGINIVADAAGAPREYITCDFCGAMEWRVPPHGFTEPCPIAEQMLEAMGAKVDAERMLAVRSGVHMEELRGFLDRMHPETDDE
jgi:hypothetical protein